MDDSAKFNEVVFFFFQAEDGIRDYKVTGVQTCALPISSACGAPPPESSRGTTSPCRAGRGRRGGRSYPLWVERPCPHAARDLLDVVGEGAFATECLRHLAHRRVRAPHSLPGRRGLQASEPLGPPGQLA